MVDQNLQDIYDIAGYWGDLFPWWRVMVLIFLLLCCLCLLSWWLWKKWKKASRVQECSTIQNCEPFEEWILRQLKELSVPDFYSADMIAREQAAAFYFRLTELMRQWLEHCGIAHAVEYTTEELTRHSGFRSFPYAHEFLDIFWRADGVKFARSDVAVYLLKKDYDFFVQIVQEQVKKNESDQRMQQERG